LGSSWPDRLVRTLQTPAWTALRALEVPRRERG